MGQGTKSLKRQQLFEGMYVEDIIQKGLMLGRVEDWWYPDLPQQSWSQTMSCIRFEW